MPDWLNISIFGLTQLVILVGLFGLIVPIFPGVVIIWLAELGYGIVKGFSTLLNVLFAMITLFLLVVVTIATVLIVMSAIEASFARMPIVVSLVAGDAGPSL